MKRREPPMVIGIAGPSCSGKSSLARHLQRILPGETRVLSLDRYYRDLSGLSPELRGARNFDEPQALEEDLLRQHLSALARGEAVEVPEYDFETHTRHPLGTLFTPGRTLLVEGLFTLYWPQVRHLLDMALYVEAGHELCLARRRIRDVAERGRTQEEVLTQFQETVQPMAERYVLPTRQYADLVLQGNSPIEQSAARLAYILPLLPHPAEIPIGTARRESRPVRMAVRK